jgi:hypothetical protein
MRMPPAIRCRRLMLLLALGLLASAGWAQEAAALLPLFPLPARPVATLAPLVQPRQLYSYERMVADARRLADTYPGLIEVSDIGRSAFGRRLLAIRLGYGSREITLNGAHHGREWITSALLMAMLDRYALAYYRGERLDGYDVYHLLNHVSIWVVPMVNPDGVALAQSGAASAPNPAQVIALNGGSRDFRAWKANGRGVDLNRQYPADWARISLLAPAPGAQNYRGKAPLSEPESQAMAAFAAQHPFVLHAALHAAGEIIFWHFYQDGALRARTERLARRLRTLTGYALIPPHGFESGGGYKDWVVQRFAVPAFTVEVGRYSGGASVPLREFPRIWDQTRTLGLLLAQEALTPGNGAGTVYGYIDGRQVAVSDSPEALTDGLITRVHQGEGALATITRAGDKRRLWRYPEAPCYRVVIDGQTSAVYRDPNTAKAVLARTMTEKQALGGFVVTPTRLLIDMQGAGVAHEVAISPHGTMTVDGVETPLPERPCERQGRRYVPLAVFAAMGAAATFDAAQYTVTLAHPAARLILVHGSALALRGETPLRLDGPVYTTARDATMVPLRSVAQALNGCVTVDPASGVVSIRWYTAPPAPA